MLNFTFTFWVNIYTMIGRQEGTGEGKEAARCGVVAVSSSSHIQFKVAFADACLNNLQSTVGLPPPLFPSRWHPLSQIEASDGRAPRVSNEEWGEGSHSSTESKSASAVGSSSLSFAQLISAIYKHVAGLLYTSLPSCHTPPLSPYRLAFAGTLFYDMLIQFSPEGFLFFSRRLPQIIYA